MIVSFLAAVDRNLVLGDEKGFPGICRRTSSDFAN